MKSTEAREIVTLLKAATGSQRLDENTVAFWEEMLLPLDAADASKTAIQGANAWTRFPSWADFKQAYNAHHQHGSAGANRNVPPTDCVTCGGDRFVLYAMRPVEQTVWMKERGIVPAADAAIEEYAACPDCNANTDTSYSVLGQRTRPPDPGQVRERLRQ